MHCFSRVKYYSVAAIEQVRTLEPSLCIKKS
jgi:hypothetical protein